MPSATFWCVAGGLHLFGVNRSYTGKITVKQMISTQLMLDILHFVSLSIYGLFNNSKFFRWKFFLCGCMLLECIEYFAHRFLHEFCFEVHAQHHDLGGVHTLGTFYNDIRELLFTGTLISCVLIGILGLTVPELSCTFCIAVVFNIYDHWPEKSTENRLSRHQIHHLYHKTDFGQPFSPLLDYVFKTRWQDNFIIKKMVLAKENKTKWGFNN